MLVFLSWSGGRSRTVAEIFARWLSQVIQAVEPWISTDIAKGARWGPAVADRLEQCRVGVICLTPENLESKWILFEAGALSKTKEAYVCTLLLGLTAADVEPPLAQFQHTAIDKDDIERLVRTINRAVAQNGERELSEHVLSQVFNTFWPQLEHDLREVAAAPAPAAVPVRSEADILDEILTTVRNLDRRQNAQETDQSWRQTLEQMLGLGRFLPAERWMEVVPNRAQVSEADLKQVLKLARASRHKESDKAAENKPATDVDFEPGSVS